MLAKPSTKFPWHYPSRVPNSQSISRAKQRVPAAKNRQSCPAVVKASDSSQLQGQNAQFFALSEAHTRTTDKNVRFPLPRPRKTVCFDRQRPKPTVFRIAHPTRQPTPFSTSNAPVTNLGDGGLFARLKNADNGNRVLPPSDWSGVTIPEYCRILNAYLRHYNERRPKGKLG